MFKHIFAFLFLLSFTFVACGDDPMPPPDEQPPPVAQDQQEDPATPGPGDVADVSDDELESFVEVNLRAAREDVDPQVDPHGFEEIIADKGLDTERYMEIQTAIQQDPRLQQEVQQLFQELQQS